MRILIVVPEQPRTTGNWVTALRHQQGLVALGHEVRLVATAGDAAALDGQVAAFKPDLVHLLHAYRAGKPWLACRQCGQVPLVVSLTGTDLNHGLDSVEQGPLIRAVLQRSQAIVLQNPLAVSTLTAALPDLAARLHLVAPGVILGGAPYPLRQRHALPAASTIFLHPAGIRPVKANLELLHLFEPVAAAAPNSLLLFCGSLLDPAYGKRFLAAVQQRPWAHYLGEIEKAAMPAALREADVVLNHSISEGLPNALLEAACLGRPILARNIPGNRAAFEPERNGLLYDGPQSFFRQALALARDAELRRRLARPSRSSRTPRQEALQLQEIYLSLPGLSSGGAESGPGDFAGT